MPRAKYLEKIRLLAEQGQHPEIMVISCSDSRVPAELVLKAEPGDMFAHRHIAALVPPFNASAPGEPLNAALEFALSSFDIRHIAILGHTQCGGIRALTEHLLNPQKPVATPAALSWMLQARDAFSTAVAKGTPENIASAVEIESLLLSLENLAEYPSVANTPNVALHAWQFDLASGKVLEHTPGGSIFPCTLQRLGVTTAARKPVP